jgi:hypothetical protein
MSLSDGSGNVWLTARDQRMLAFMAEHRLVLETQISALLGSPNESVQRRLRTLAAKGYLTRWPGFDASRCCAIRPRGLAAIGSRLRPPRENPGMYWHDIGVAGLWLAAQRGAFGPLAEVIGERRIRSHDMVAREEPYAIRLGGHHGDGRERRHYPDLLLVDRHGRRLALELELSLKEKARREEILAGYGADRRVIGVLYLVEDTSHGRAIGRAVQATAAELGVTDCLRVRRLNPIARGHTGQDLGHPARERGSTGAEAVL